VDLDADVRRQIWTAPDLRAYARDLGFDLDLDTQARALIAALKQTLRAEVDDVAALQAAVASARARVDGPGSRFEAEDHDLLEQVAAAGSDRAAILALLNRDPLNAPLPFVERIPMVRNGVTSWRTPVEHALIRRRPADLGAFERLAGELEAVFAAPQIGARELSRLQVADALDRVRRDGRRENAYVPTALQLLDRKVADFLACGAGPVAARRFEQLHALVRQLTERERALDADMAPETEHVTELASRYVATDWLHVRSLTDRIVALLLARPYVLVSIWYRRRRFYRVIALLRQEVMQGHYDGGEIARRLQRLETEGAFFSSLVYPALRIADAKPAAARRPSAGSAAPLR